ncbi:MAG TPA: SufE family protein [Bacteroidales bacterium]|nr:SufE family protein [Bacteroidales bacterium]HPT03121.1 SufE family protein [Bacteroidales bacterium]
MTIKETIGQIINEFGYFDDWMDKYNFLIEMGKSMPLIEEKYKVDSNLITGCQSRVWLHANFEDGRIFFTADSDAVITKGIVYLLIRVFSGHSPDEILEAQTSFLDSIGLKEHLSPTRSNGLLSMVKQIKLYALAFKTQQEQKEGN